MLTRSSKRTGRFDEDLSFAITNPTVVFLPAFWKSRDTVLMTTRINEIYLIHREQILCLEKRSQYPLFWLRDENRALDLCSCFTIGHENGQVVLELL